MIRQQGGILWVTRITEALSRDKFELFCQPIVSLSSNKSAQRHYEILLRLKEVNSHLTPPGAFIPAAERYNMITLLDRWVVDHVFDYLQQRQRMEKLRFFINLSGKSLGDKALLAHIENRIRNGDVIGNEICFEIAESAAVISLSAARYFMEPLKTLGCSFSLDDFGRGMSSFSYLKALPVDYIKIDGSFIREIATDPVGHGIVNAINQIAHTMQLQTVAELVESETILGVLQRMEVDYAQGFHICEPFPITELSNSDEWNITPPKDTDLV